MKANSPKLSIKKEKENCQPKVRKYLLSIKVHSKMALSLIPTKIGKVPSILYSDKEESSRGGTKALPA